MGYHDCRESVPTSSDVPTFALQDLITLRQKVLQAACLGSSAKMGQSSNIQIQTLLRGYSPASFEERFPTIGGWVDVFLTFCWWIEKKYQHVEPSQLQVKLCKACK